ncbi:hypothetical protein R5W23_001615 [Gemmata sp. JC673]|uniref:Twin-arginine translocation signal domain-containing protein n=1 Tax=Gemmata algarum TaxID=2975278 RepID=A0ABU5F392_9BACT|nr:hypothetical protein [Gemmata algarum]MDY3560381.1 hypothetical protein [Gemmata algarum]
MERRQFIKQGLAGGALALGAGGTLFARRSYGRDTLSKEMVDDAMPAFQTGANKGLNALPGRAREQIYTYFHGVCLNCQGFVAHITSKAFGERISRCGSKAEKELCFNEAFVTYTDASADAILRQIDIIATDIGGELDHEWNTYCADLSVKWKTRIGGRGTGFSADELTQRMSGLVRTGLEDALQQTSANHQNTALGNTIGAIGKSAVKLLPLVKLGKVGVAIAIPAFFILAAKHCWDYSMARLDDRRGEYQTAITDRISNMAARIGTEFEKDVRQRITDLHTWQESSIRETAERVAQEKIGLL